MRWVCRRRRIRWGDAQRRFAEQLVEQAQAEGVSLVGPGGLLAELTKRVLATGLEAEMSEHLGYDKHAVVGRDGGNSRNGTRSKTVITEVGPVGIEVPRDREGSFEPRIVRKRQRRLDGVDAMVLSLCAKGLTTGEISAHLAEVYGTDARFRRSTRARGHFPNEQAALQRLYLVVRSLDPTGRGSERWMNRWKPALNAFAVTFEGRLFPTDQ